MRAALAPLLLGALALAGCNLMDGPVCTEIGCDDGLVITVEEGPPGGFTVAVLVGDETVLTAACSEPTCAFGIRGETPGEVTVRLSWDGGAREETFRPDYRTHQPNGRDCPPVCRQAAIRLRLA